MSKSIDEIRQNKKTLSAEILKLIKEFQDYNGVNISYLGCESGVKVTGEPVILNVDLRIEL